MAQLQDQDDHIEEIRQELVKAYRKASESNYTAGAEVAEAAIASVNDAEAAVLTAENAVAQVRMLSETGRK